MVTDWDETAGDDPDPYESELQSVVDMHDYSALRDVIEVSVPGGNPCQTEVKLPAAGDQQDLDNMA